ncbi:MAG: type VI secretion system tube protein Hcp [Armatimonadota bacterium]|jgi:type VI protein secretion system component Hcp
MSRASSVAVLRLGLCVVMISGVCRQGVAQVRIDPQSPPARVIQLPQPGLAAASATGTFLRLDGVEGSGPGGAMQVKDWRFGATSSFGLSRGAGGGAAGRADVADVVVVKPIDAATPVLFVRTMDGRIIANGELRLELPNATLRIVMQNIRIAAAGRMPDDAGPLEFSDERIVVSAEQYTLHYEPQAGNVVVRGWDVRTNRETTQ